MTSSLFFSFRGRLRRTRFWIAAFALALAFGLGFVALERLAGRASTLLLYAPFFWSGLALTTQRLHDRNRSGAWLVLLLVPILGPLWLTVQLALLRGTRGDNRYGADPRTA